MDRLAFWRTRLERPSAGLLAIGLVVAVVAADDLPTAWSTALFAVLLVLDAITIAWLTRPCEEGRPSSTAGALHNRTNAGASMPTGCGAAR